VFDLSPLKIIVVVTVVLILLGPDKLPEVSRKLGATWRTIKQFQEKVETEVREVIPQLPNSGDFSRLVRSPIGLLNHLADRADLGDDAESEYVANDDANKLEPIFGSKVSKDPPLDYVTGSSPTADPSLN
jgi:sec-independent protein translocase protein TatB